MNKADPLTAENIAEIQKQLNCLHSRYMAMFLIGLDTGLRISDILALKAGQIMRPSFKVIEKKTGKSRTIKLSRNVLKFVRDFIKSSGIAPDEYIVFSSPLVRSKALSRSQAYKVMSNVGKRLKIENMSPHSMRKTYARSLFDESGSLAAVQEALNHKYVTTTLLYLFGDLEEAARGFKKST